LDQLIFKRDVAFLAHVQGNYQSFDQIVFGLEVLKGDLFQTVQDFEVIGSVCDDCL
jgi:hypothetical protein